MKISTKTILLMGSVMLALFAVLSVLSGHIVRRGFSQVEDRYARRNVERIERAIEERQENLETAVADWTTWDALYRFAADGNEEFALENLKPDSFFALKIRLLVIVDAAGVPIWKGMLDEKGAWLPAVSQSLVDLAHSTSPLAVFDAAHPYRAGVIVHEGRPMVIVARPILTSKSEGPTHGVLLMGRDLDTDEVRRMSQVLRLQFALHCLSNVKDADEKAFVQELTTKGKFALIRKPSAMRLTGYGLVRDVFGKPAVLVRVDMSRDIFAQGTKTMQMFFVVLASVGVIFIAMVIWLLRMLILSRLEMLSGRIGDISRTKDFTQRVAASGSDELTHLASDINMMLDCVVASRRDLAAAHQEIQEMSHELRRLERVQFKAVLDEMGDAVVVCDEAWAIRDINRTATQLLHLGEDTRTDVLGHLSALFDLSVDRSALTDPAVRHIRFELVRPATVQINALYLDAAMDVIRSQSGGSLRRVLVLRDVSEARREEMIKQDFLGLISHKLRTPVAVIGENAEMLTDVSLGGVLTQTQAPMVQAVLEQTRILQSLIEKLLSFAELRGSKPARMDDRVELGSYLNELAGWFMRTVSLKTVEVRVTCADDLAVLCTNRMCFDLIMDNLIENAVKFADKTPTVIELSARMIERGIVLTVSDNGPGIPPEELEKLFSAFHQIEKGFTGQVEGVGLGLALVKRLVEACSGSVEVQSTLGKGTVFMLVFPRT